MVNSMTMNISKVNSGTAEVVSALDVQKEATESAYGNFQVISDSIEDLNSLITSISAAVSEQSATTQEIMDSIGGVAESSNETGGDVMTELINDTDSC